jgi:hypothetical protein
METKASILATKEDLARAFGNTKTGLIRWMFFFWVAQLITTFGLLLLFLK